MLCCNLIGGPAQRRMKGYIAAPGRLVGVGQRHSPSLRIYVIPVILRMAPGTGMAKQGRGRRSPRHLGVPPVNQHFLHPDLHAFGRSHIH
jgi:hypothetical protein